MYNKCTLFRLCNFFVGIIIKLMDFLDLTGIWKVEHTWNIVYRACGILYIDPCTSLCYVLCCSKDTTRTPQQRALQHLIETVARHNYGYILLKTCQWSDLMVHYLTCYLEWKKNLKEGLKMVSILLHRFSLLLTILL